MSYSETADKLLAAPVDGRIVSSTHGGTCDASLGVAADRGAGVGAAGRDGGVCGRGVGAGDAVGECATRIINLGARLVAEPTPERLVAFDRLVTHFRGELGETGFLVAQHCIGSARYTLGINIVCGGA